MPLRRMGRPGLIGVAARTAVVAGTASAVVGHQQRKTQAAAADAQAQADAQYAQQYAQPAPPPAPAEAPAEAAPDLTQQIEQLSGLHTAGVLTDEEFAAAKAKLFS
ncbi:hypothetical protein GY21_07435 [Cryobacterium roopkundense]|uniref:SHOCT domain-containing protein n=1 Tax=Cryobacterium roopkundense TaxID=1001240 RepID=A0A099JH48_9MICO|nr:SHOCT domain-containing protein [Cryobacterium roopkundense]KGJ77531.1 hypothetical protein GY21_07435 [Cryobacterium roopkundense]MBB5640748.1 hypothetical protein [Cryobacterium roopkundense]